MRKVNLENIHSPCHRCYSRGHSYSSEDDYCKRCEYNIAIIALKRILKCNDFCTLCGNCIHLGGGHFDCKLETCDVDEDFIIDWESVFKEYPN